MRVRDLAFLTAYNTSQSKSKPKTITAYKKNDFNYKFISDKSCPTIFRNWELNFSYRRKKFILSLTTPWISVKTVDPCKEKTQIQCWAINKTAMPNLWCIKSLTEYIHVCQWCNQFPQWHQNKSAKNNKTISSQYMRWLLIFKILSLYQARMSRT